MNGIPRLEAHLLGDGTLWWVRCPWCKARHHHALPVGRVVCHCSRTGGPYERTGYIGVLAGSEKTP